MQIIKLIMFGLAVLALLALRAPARAGGPIALTVTNCSNDAELRNKLTDLQSGEGGWLEFSCGTATITLTDILPAIKTDTTIDGGGKITLSGNNAHRLFYVTADGSLKLNNIILEKGYYNDRNGGAISSEGVLVLDKATIRSSRSDEKGGAIAAYHALEITDSTFANNSAESGGAIFAGDLGSNTLKITNSKFFDNTASLKWGGAIYAVARVDIRKSEFARNKAGSGGAIFSESSGGSSTVIESSFHDNKTTGQAPYGEGGALALKYQTVMSLSNTLFQKNTADKGGAVFVGYYATWDALDSTFVENRAASGAGMYNDGRATLTNVTFERNTASLSGGGIENNQVLILTNSTLSGNQAQYGGGLKSQDMDGGANLTNVTLSRNLGASTSAGGILIASASSNLFLRNVIVGKGASGMNCLFGTAPRISEYNLSNDATCSFGTGRDNVELKLALLANNGGLTKTHLPNPGSPAINNGTASNAPGADQRGVLRPQGTVFDVGAVEVVPAAGCTSKPIKPNLTRPTDTKQVERLRVKLDWDDDICATKYKVKIMLGSPTGEPVQKKGGLTTSEFKTKELVSGQTYAWRVIAINEAGKTKSDWWTFTVK